VVQENDYSSNRIMFFGQQYPVFFVSHPVYSEHGDVV